MGGDRNKVIKVNKRHEARLAKIFADSDDDSDADSDGDGDGDVDNRRESTGANTEKLLEKLDNFQVPKATVVIPKRGAKAPPPLLQPKERTGGFNFTTNKKDLR